MWIDSCAISTPASSSCASTRRSAATLTVVGDTQDQVVLLAGGCCEHALGRLHGVRGGELELEVAAADASLELYGRALGHDTAALEDRDPVGEMIGLLQVPGTEW